MQFIPYSSWTAWAVSYPGAFPCVDCDAVGNDCDAAGNVTVFLFWSPRANSASDIPPEVEHAAVDPTMAGVVARSVAVSAGGRGPRTVIAARKQDGGGPGRKLKAGTNNRLMNTLLSNGERNELHTKIHGYFSWLVDRVVESDTSERGRRLVK